MGSPGQYNNTEKKLFHLSCFSDPVFFTPQDTLSFYIINDGYFSLPEQQIVLHTPLQENSFMIPESEPGDTLYFSPDTQNIFQSGTQVCSLSSETFFSYNFKYYTPFHDPPCFFNEFLFEPIDTYGQVEFIELECRLNELDLDHWRLRINNSLLDLDGILFNTYNVLCDSDDPVTGIANATIYAYSTFPSLPNAGADCYLFDPMGNVVDHCDLRNYSELHKGKSLEKQFPFICSDDPDIWYASVSRDGMTPGRRNSITALPGLQNKLNIYPDIFSPGTDERIQFSIDSETSLAYCELLCFNLAGQLIYRKEQGLFSQPSCLLFWDGKMDNGNYPSRGLYLAVAVMHGIEGNTYQLRGTFAIK